MLISHPGLVSAGPRAQSGPQEKEGGGGREEEGERRMKRQGERIRNSDVAMSRKSVATLHAPSDCTQKRTNKSSVYSTFTSVTSITEKPMFTILHTDHVPLLAASELLFYTQDVALRNKTLCT